MELKLEQKRYKFEDETDTLLYKGSVLIETVRDDFTVAGYIDRKGGDMICSFTYTFRKGGENISKVIRESDNLQEHTLLCDAFVERIRNYIDES